MYPAPVAAQYAALSDGGTGNNGLVIHQFGNAAAAGAAMMQQQQQQQRIALSQGPQQQQQQQQPQQQPQQYILAQPMVAAAQQPMMTLPPATASCGPLMQMGLQLTPNQMTMLSPQLYSIVSMSGTDISTVPAANGMFLLNISGFQSQVDNARGLVMSLLSQIQAAGMM
jgi:transcription initiation factor TFIID subunit TAF12